MVADNENRKEARAIYRILTKTYPEIRCELDFKNPLELIVAVVLSAQCTDKRVNTITPALFKKYKKAKDYAKAPLAEIEEYIFSAGFYHAKARHLKGLGRKLVEDFDGQVPATIEELIQVWEEKLPTLY
jgi:endonuclease-3